MSSNFLMLRESNSRQRQGCARQGRWQHSKRRNRPVRSDRNDPWSEAIPTSRTSVQPRRALARSFESISPKEDDTQFPDHKKQIPVRPPDARCCTGAFPFSTRWSGSLTCIPRWLPC